MKNNRFLLDTCILIWLLKGDERVVDFFSKNLYADFAISIDSLKEMFYKRSKGTLKLDFDYKHLLKTLVSNNIKVCAFDDKILKTLYELPYYEAHKDTNDRAIIAMSIALHFTLVSADRLFFHYEKSGLDYILV